MTVDAATRHRALSSPSRTAILAVLRAEGAGLAVERVAERVGLHVNTTREHLEVLVAAGLASRTAEARATRGRPRTLYAARGPAEPDGEPWLRDQLSRVLLAGYGRPIAEPGAEAERAAEGLAAELAALGPTQPAEPAPPADPAAPVAPTDPTGARDRQLAALHEHFARLGFDPELRGAEVRLRRCPVLDLAHERTEVVCGVHLGLARGVLARVGGPVQAAGIVPFAGPGYCVLRLAGVAPAPGPTSEAAPLPG
ncbi:metalloregulator ArsR/SmtB family transcription factor [Cellulomonas sp. PS-H5]|uniref:helix-turn-helix transcriptional regulator n=1 Tax=Cellulomonas sp. PS-H5 TaxID=2820400 RepID=UPI001C5005F0|nr:helix-turn-helix domain-containing protein [Cellulomonas sp. PS-H5]MBW0253454.1 helix-turn-helix domain-containing protein [Cellulomonas sp. PS-H5]